MSNIKTVDGTKLNIKQVCELLAEKINAEQANVIMVHGDGASNIVSPKVRFAHMVLDSYKHLPSITEQDMEIKKLAKHLMEKYMKSSVAEEQDRESYEMLLKVIATKAEGLR